MKTHTTQRAHQKVEPGERIQLFNLMGPNPSITALLAKLKKRKAEGTEKKALNALDLASPLPLSGSSDDLPYWSDFYQRQHGRIPDEQLEDRALAVRDYVGRGGQDTGRGLLGRLLGNTFDPRAVYRSQNAARGYQEALTGLARKYQAAGIDPESAMLRARQSLGDEQSFRGSLLDEVFQHGSSWQQANTDSDQLLDARARSTVAGGEGGGSAYSGLAGGLDDYLSGNQRLQDAASRQTQIQQAKQQAAEKSQLGRLTARDDLGQITDFDQYRRNQWLKQRGLASVPSQALQADTQTGDWSRDEGLAGWLPWLGAGAQGTRSKMDADLERAHRDANGLYQTSGYDWLNPLESAPNAGKRLYNAVRNSGIQQFFTGDQADVHGALKDRNEAYRYMTHRLDQGLADGTDDLSQMQQGERGSAYGWLDPRQLWDRDGRSGNRNGVNFVDAFAKNKGLQGTLVDAATGRLTADQVEGLRQRWSSVQGDQRQALGIDKYLDEGLSKKRQDQANAMMAMSDWSARHHDVPATPRPDAGTKLPSAQANPPPGAALPEPEKLPKPKPPEPTEKVSFASPYFVADQTTPTKVQSGTPEYQQSGAPKRLQQLWTNQQQMANYDPQAQAAQWADYRGGNMFRPQEDRAYGRSSAELQADDRPWHQQVGGWIGRKFMTEDDVRAYDPQVVKARQMLQAGRWQPGMNVQQMATGTGWRLPGLSHLTDFAGLTTSPEEQARQFQQQQVQSQDWKELMNAYQAGTLSAQQLQTLAGAPLSELNQADPQQYLKQIQQARAGRSRLGLDSMLSRAQEIRQDALGDHYDALGVA